jgi:hypothetical protein
MILIENIPMWNRSCLGWHQWKGEVARKGSRRVNTVQKCVHMYINAKMIPVETSA